MVKTFFALLIFETLRLDFSIFWKANAIEARCTPLNGSPGLPGQDFRALPSVLAGNALTMNVQNMLTIGAWDCKPAFKPNLKIENGQKKCIKWPAGVLQNVTQHGINSCKHSDIFPCQYLSLRGDNPLYFKRVACKLLNIFN